MDALWGQLLVNIPVGVVLLLSIMKFLAHIATENQANRILWSNHLEKSVEVQARMAAVLEAHSVLLKQLVDATIRSDRRGE